MTPPNLLDVPIDAHYTSYCGAVAAAGGLPVHLTRAADPGEVVGRLDGLLVAGGQDVDPRTYGAEAVASMSYVDPARDSFELELIAVALERRIPVLGICRGAQLINVARGGSLIVDIASVQEIKHDNDGIFPSDARVHSVGCEPGSLMADLYGSSLQVNSYHHQGIGDLGYGVVVTATASDGVVEAIELDSDAGALGVQWHPEHFSPRDPIFSWLVGAATGRRREPGSGPRPRG